MDRERLVEAMAEAMAEMSGILVWASINDWAQGIWLKRARAALAVAEPVVRADEREECAKVAMEYPVLENETAPTAHARVMQGLAIAVAIRSRGEPR